MESSISTWLDFSIQHLVSESHLDGVDFTDVPQVQLSLTEGTNHPTPEIPLSTEHPTRMTQTQADWFTDNYEIAHHKPNQASGFSATLIQSKRDPTVYTLAIRSSELRFDINGGDRARDVDGADSELLGRGFAFGQLVDLEAYYAELTDPDGLNLLPPGSTLNLTGYSLSSHLATVFTEMHPEAVNHAYVFNGPGRGNFDESVGTLADMLAHYQAVFADPPVRIHDSP